MVRGCRGGTSLRQKMEINGIYVMKTLREIVVSDYSLGGRNYQHTKCKSTEDIRRCCNVVNVSYQY